MNEIPPVEQKMTRKLSLPIRKPSPRLSGKVEPVLLAIRTVRTLEIPMKCLEAAAPLHTTQDWSPPPRPFSRMEALQPLLSQSTFFTPLFSFSMLYCKIKISSCATTPLLYGLMPEACKCVSHSLMNLLKRNFNGLCIPA